MLATQTSLGDPCPRYIPKWMWEYAQNILKENNVDESHDLQHLVNVYNYAFDLMYKSGFLETPNAVEKMKVLLIAAFCHDLVDKKYMNEEEGLKRLKEEFTLQLLPHDISLIIRLIREMSYSKRRENRAEGNPDFYPGLAHYLQILSEADLLDAYRVERVIAYQNHMWPDDPETAKRWCKTILVKRILRYLPDKYITSKRGVKLAEPMHKEVEQYVRENYPEDLEMFDY